MKCYVSIVERTPHALKNNCNNGFLIGKYDINFSELLIYNINGTKELCKIFKKNFVILLFYQIINLVR